jgi:hypothetical protein
MSSPACSHFPVTSKNRESQAFVETYRMATGFPEMPRFVGRIVQIGVTIAVSN